MFQAKIKDVVVFKKIIDSLSNLVSEVNLEATSTGLSLQAMDSAHVSLVSLCMKEEGFEEYRCDKNTTLGLNLIVKNEISSFAIIVITSLGFANFRTFPKSTKFNKFN